MQENIGVFFFFLVQHGSEGSPCCYFQPHLFRPQAKMQLEGQKIPLHTPHLTGEPVSFEPVTF